MIPVNEQDRSTAMLLGEIASLAESLRECLVEGRSGTDTFEIDSCLLAQKLMDLINGTDCFYSSVFVNSGTRRVRRGHQ